MSHPAKGFKAGGATLTPETVGVVYVMRPLFDGLPLDVVKVGFTRDIRGRRAALTKGAFYSMDVVAWRDGTQADEDILRSQLRAWAVKGKRDWYAVKDGCLDAVAAWATGAAIVLEPRPTSQAQVDAIGRRVAAAQEATLYRESAMAVCKHEAGRRRDAMMLSGQRDADILRKL